MSKVLLAVCGFLLLAGCAPDAPHDNALDPASSQHAPAGSLSGRVTGKKLPTAGIPAALLTLLPSNLATTSDSSGYFSFATIAPGVQILTVQKDGYLSDTLSIEIPNASTVERTIPLDQFPFIAAPKALTQKIDQWWPGPIYSVSCTAAISDPDGETDIDSVWLNAGSVQFSMEYSPTTRNFQAVVFAEQLPSNNLEWLIGKPLTIAVRDMSKVLVRSEPFYVTRIIEQEGIPVYPSPQDTITGAPEFRWSPPSVAFTYTYTVTVVRTDAGVPTVVATQKQIDPHQYSWQSTQTFQTGSYFWTLSVVDEFGNLSQSKQASFYCR